VDDVARGLIVGAREPRPSIPLRKATTTYLTFLDHAVQDDGRVHNRRNTVGEWTDQPTVGDWWGRALWACGIAASMLGDEAQRDIARAIAFRAMQQESPFVRANVFASIGASVLLLQNPEDDACRAFLVRAVAAIPLESHMLWEWPEDRLSYGNGSYADAVIAAGAALEDSTLLGRGLELLTFLLEQETRNGRFSVTGVGGSGPFTARPQFDQQPIEVAALADACARAFSVTGDVSWLEGVALAWAWFEGHNDSHLAMYDPDTGAGFDGLERRGRNANRGAESTLAALNTLQHVLHVQLRERELS
jgi:hypothetical protein